MVLCCLCRTQKSFVQCSQMYRAKIEQLPYCMYQRKKSRAALIHVRSDHGSDTNTGELGKSMTNGDQWKIKYSMLWSSMINNKAVHSDSLVQGLTSPHFLHRPLRRKKFIFDIFSATQIINGQPLIDIIDH